MPTKKRMRSMGSPRKFPEQIDKHGEHYLGHEVDRQKGVIDEIPNSRYRMSTDTSPTLKPLRYAKE